jgi:hypothetical protein
MGLNLPTFIYAGPPKSGSTWLGRILSEHPDVFVPQAKDIMYFDSHYDRPISWYHSFFARSGSASQAGEVCHNYFDYAHAAERIRTHLPDVKLLFILREPVERAVSHWVFERALGMGNGIDFAGFCRRPDIAAINNYVANLSRYYERFPSAQIRVFFYAQIKSDPAALIREVYEFLGVDPTFVPPSLRRRILSARETRWPLLSATAYRMAKWIRRRGGANLVGWLKKRSLLHRVLFKKLGERPRVPVADLEAFFESQRATFSELSRLTGKEVPGEWHISPPHRAEPRQVHEGDSASISSRQETVGLPTLM